MDKRCFRSCFLSMVFPDDVIETSKNRRFNSLFPKVIIWHKGTSISKVRILADNMQINIFPKMSLIVRNTTLSKVLVPQNCACKCTV